MKKSLKKCYQNLELDINSTEQDVKTREKALIKILKAKEVDENVNLKEDIKKVKSSAKEIIENIKVNGIPKEEHFFESSSVSIFTMLTILFFISILCFVSFYVLM